MKVPTTKIVCFLFLLVLAIIVFLCVSDALYKIITGIIGIIVSFLPLLSFNKKKSIKSIAYDKGVAINGGNNITVNMAGDSIKNESDHNKILYYKEDKVLWEQFIEKFPKVEFDALISLQFGDYLCGMNRDSVVNYVENSRDIKRAILDLDFGNKYGVLLDSIDRYLCFLAINTFSCKGSMGYEFAKEWREMMPDRYSKCVEELHTCSRKCKEAYDDFYDFAKRKFATPIV